MKQFNQSCSTNDSGFSLIELLVYLAILGILMTLVMNSFVKTMGRTWQQSSIAETKIESGIGLDLLRSDLEHAGFGLPWQFMAVPSPYSEPAPMADVPNIPRGLIGADTSADSLNGADYLVIRATNAVLGTIGQKWGYVGRDINHNIDVQSMSDESFVSTDRVVVVRPKTSPIQYHELIMDGQTYSTQPTAAGLANFAPVATPNDPDGERFLIYGLNDNGNVRRPFNRTDYYISADASLVPAHCAANTGVLVKATLNQADDNFSVLPIVDCVADFQIVYYLDTDGDGGWDQRSDAGGLSGLSAAEIRDQVKAVYCYILTHEGRVDNAFTYPSSTINVGEVDVDGVTLVAGAGRSFDLTSIGGNWSNYRWKIETVAITPKNLR